MKKSVMLYNRTTDREDVPTLCVSGKCLFGKGEIDIQ